MKYVYAFEEGGREQKFLLGGKGANLAEMTNLGLPVPPGFTITTDACNAYMAAGDTLPAGLMDEVAAARDALEAEDGQAARRRHRPAARLGALGRAVLDAGDDGHRPQPRAQRRLGARASPSRRTTSGSRTTRTAASCRCSARSCSTSPATCSRRRCTTSSRRRASASTPSSSADDLAGLVETFKADRARTKPASTSRPIPIEQLALRDRSRVQVVERPAAHATTASSKASPTTSAPRSTCRRWCSATRATTPAPASRSRATRRPVRTRRTATSSPTRRAKTSWPASASPSRSTRWATTSPSRTSSCSR